MLLDVIKQESVERAIELPIGLVRPDKALDVVAERRSVGGFRVVSKQMSKNNSINCRVTHYARFVFGEFSSCSRR